MLEKCMLIVVSKTSIPLYNEEQEDTMHSSILNSPLQKRLNLPLKENRRRIFKSLILFLFFFFPPFSIEITKATVHLRWWEIDHQHDEALQLTAFQYLLLLYPAQAIPFCQKQTDKITISD